MGWADKFRRADSGKGLIINPTPPPPSAFDHHGRPLRPGDEVLTTAPQTSWRVQEIVPVLQPGAPPGLVRVRMVAVADAVVESGQRLEGLHRLRTVEELAPTQTMQQGQAEPSADEKPTTLVVP